LIKINHIIQFTGKKGDFMKKSFFAIVAIALLLALTSTTQTSAQTLSGDWSSSISCQNQSDTNLAHVELLFFEEDTGVETTIGSTDIPASRLVTLGAHFVKKPFAATTVEKLASVSLGKVKLHVTFRYKDVVRF